MGNIEKIINFIKNDQPFDLHILSLGEEIDYFYLYLVNSFSTNYKISIISKGDKINDVDLDLFENKIIYVFLKNNTKEIELQKDKTTKKIFFVNYLYYKNSSNKNLTINSYDYANDIKYYLSKFLDIDNKTLLSNILKSPSEIFSEINKFLVNRKKYPNILEKENIDENIGFIRQEFYRVKTKDKSNSKNLYKIIKNEALKKKFSFLTY